MAHYFVRLCGEDSDDLFVPLVHNPQVYRRVQTRMVETQVIGLSDSHALMGILLDGRSATVGDLRQGRAQDITFLTWTSDDYPTYWNALDNSGTAGYLLYVVYAETGYNITVAENRVSVREHAERIREALLKASEPVAHSRPETEALPDTMVRVSRALYVLLRHGVEPELLRSGPETYLVPAKSLKYVPYSRFVDAINQLENSCDSD